MWELLNRGFYYFLDVDVVIATSNMFPDLNHVFATTYNISPEINHDSDI